MTVPRMVYDRKHHAAVRTSEYLFNQLIPYIGNKRKLLRLIHRRSSAPLRKRARFVDFFAGSGVVSRMAKLLGLSGHRQRLGAVRRGDQPLLHRLQPAAGVRVAGRLRTGDRTLERPAGRRSAGSRSILPPRRRALRHSAPTACSTCARTACGSTPSASRSPPGKTPGRLTDVEEACLLAPLVYQACYRSNTSGVFKGFHNGWGGQTKTALYRIATDLRLDVPVFYDNGQREPRLSRGCPNAGRAVVVAKKSRSPISIRPTTSIPTAATITC